MTLFGLPLKSFWTIILLVTIAVEVVPIPILPPVPFYSYCFIKAVLFLTLGYLSPLAFSRFNAMNRGVIVAGGSAAFIELLQGFSKHGHTFHAFELGLKLLLILAGFSFGIVSRYDRGISFGGVRIHLTEARP